MLLIEKQRQNEEKNYLCINSENDFKELDNEIDKVIRGEASFEEEKTDYNSDKELKEKKVPNYPENQQKNKEDNLNKIKLLQYLYQIQQNNLKNCNPNLISQEKQQNQFNQNNIYLNNIINNQIINNSRIFNNNLVLNTNYIQNGNQCSNYINSELNKFIYINNNNYNDCNNNNQILNFLNINSCNQMNNNTLNNNVNNINVNNIPLAIINNELLKGNPKIQDNNLINGNNNNNINNNIILLHLLNNFNNNILNNINLNDPSLQIQMQLLNNNCIDNNIINNMNQIDLNNFKDIHENINLNLINNNSQIDYNNISLKNKIADWILSRIIINQNIQNNQKKSLNENCKSKKNHNSNLNKRKNNNTKPDLDINKNIINLMEIFLLKDKRTTIMIKNIPNKYTISTFLAEINTNFKYTYDIFYLPIDYVNKCNLGFAFINFVEPFHIILFYELYRGKKWKKFNSDKLCELLYAKFQGKKELIAHFEKGKVLSMTSEEKRPLILPTPNPLPKIKLPIYYFDLFIKIYPNISYEIKDYKSYKNNKYDKNNSSSSFPFFSIKGNFLYK